MAYNRQTQPLQVLKWAGVVAAIYFVYTKFFAKSPMQQVFELNDQKAAEVSTQRMANGKSYYSMGVELVEAMYDGYFIPWISWTDHELVGNLMLSVQPHEYENLNRVYQAIKQEASYFFTAGVGGTLTTDLTKLFSKSELRMYCGHLFTIS